MILLQDDKKQKYNFEITKFPDGTSQVWKVSPEPRKFSKLEVVWFFENEAELFHVLQLGTLLYKGLTCNVTLNVPYLPFGRQDKSIANNLTFAKKVFIEMVYQAGYENIKTYDAHSESYFIESQKPTQFLQTVAKDYDVICFPDKGALDRYVDLIPEKQAVICEKVRNQQTGEIEGLKLVELAGKIDLSDSKVLVIDDICDGGRTFIEVAKVLKEVNAKELGLAVSHGIFSKGRDVIFHAGFDKIFTTNTVLKNKPGKIVVHYGSIGTKTGEIFDVVNND